MAGRIGELTISGQDKPERGNRNSNWRQNVDSHEFFYQKMRFKSSVPPVSIVARDTSLAYQAHGFFPVMLGALPSSAPS